jgi:hypothetical protein
LKCFELSQKKILTVQIFIVILSNRYTMHKSLFCLTNTFSLSVNILAVAHGAQLGWVSPVMPYLRSEETHLTGGPITSQEASWIGE